MDKIKDIKEGYAIIMMRKYNRSLRNTPVERYVSNKEEAIYNAQALFIADAISYGVYDCKNQRLIY